MQRGGCASTASRDTLHRGSLSRARSPPDCACCRTLPKSRRNVALSNVAAACSSLLHGVVPAEVIDRNTAISRAAADWNSSVRKPEDEFAVSGAHLNEGGDFWIVSGNSRAWIEHGDMNRLFVGLSCYLVDSSTGELFTVGSAGRPDDVIYDIRSERAAAGRSYVLGSACSEANRESIAAIRRVVTCGMLCARDLLIGQGRDWFTGTRRSLESLSQHLDSHGLRTEIRMIDAPTGLVDVDGEPSWAIHQWQAKIDGESVAHPRSGY